MCTKVPVSLGALIGFVTPVLGTVAISVVACRMGSHPALPRSDSAACVAGQLSHIYAYHNVESLKFYAVHCICGMVGAGIVCVAGKVASLVCRDIPSQKESRYYV